MSFLKTLFTEDLPSAAYDYDLQEPQNGFSYDEEGYNQAQQVYPGTAGTGRMAESLHTDSLRVGSGQMVVILKPVSMEDCDQLVRHLRNKHSVILNFEHTDPRIGQRLLDYVSGAVASLEGKVEMITPFIHMATPSGVNVLSAAHEDTAYVGQAPVAQPRAVDSADFYASMRR